MDCKGILFFDYDGTLSDETQRIYFPTETTKNTLSQLQKNGYKIVLATGRAKSYAPDTGINFDGYCLSNGAYAEIDGKTVFESYIDESLIYPLIEEFERKNLFYSLENQECCYALDIKNPVFLAMLDNFNISHNIFTKLDKSKLPKVSKLLVSFNDMEELKYFRSRFSDTFVFDLHRKFLSSDVTQKGLNKATGAKAIAESLGINRDKIYAFGDGTNDYDMLKFAGHGVAMGYHDPLLDEVCEIVTDTVKNEGITKAIKKYNLI